MLILLWVSLALAESCPHGSDRFNCVTFVKNYDGDTLTMNVPGVHPFFGSGIKVRVRGIDTPEMKGHAPCEKEWGRTAKGLVQAELRHAKRIDLRVNFKDKFDKYGRLLADVLYDGKNLREVLLKNQLAVEYFGKKKSTVDWCRMKEKVKR